MSKEGDVVPEELKSQAGSIARTAEQIIDDMTLFDDDLMSMVFDGNIEAAELLLRIIFRRARFQMQAFLRDVLSRIF
jgi:hypothetical protein